MPKLKAGTIRLTSAEDATITAAAKADPYAEPLTAAEWAKIEPLVRRGRPLVSGDKIKVTLKRRA